MKNPDRPVPLASLYGLFFVVGLSSFGGGLTAWFHREVVLARQWMTDDEFFSGYSLAQVLPGVNSTNMAVYIGQHLRGAIGAAVAFERAAHRAVLHRYCGGRHLQPPA
jgi:chromate transporter